MGGTEPAEVEAFEPAARRVLRRMWRLLQGSSQRPTYWLTRFLFLRGLGMVYAVAFATALFQLVPLIGAEGILPVDRFLDRVREIHGSTAAGFRELPTVFWWHHGDLALMVVSATGLALSIAVMLGLTNAVALAVLWALYLSIDHVGQRWYAFGWESQLLETGFVAIFFASARSWRPLDRRHPPSTVVLWLLRWLAFRIMLGAGLIKLRGDPCWSDLSCLQFHFETQPVPNPMSWWLHQAPTWVLETGVLVNHVVELVVPWLLFGPRRVRHVAGIALVGFQLMLISSGNLSFLNWLTILPCLACFDDGALRRLVPARVWHAVDASARQARPTKITRWLGRALALLVAWRSIDVVANLAGGRRQAMNRSYDRLHLVNTYGAFGSVGRERYELVVEGTMDRVPDDGARWREYVFACKPGPVERMPCVITPYHHRLDWLMWFAALEAARTGGLHREAWLLSFLHRLLDADENVLGLLQSDPFDGECPRFVRVVLYRYAFTRLKDRTNAWWHRSRIGVFIRPLSADDSELQAVLRAQDFID